MALNDLSTYITDGSIREDLRDIIVNIDPVETPVLSGVEMVPAKDTTHIWMTDTLAAATGAGSVEGLVIAATNLGMPTRQSNITMIIRREFRVTDTQEAVDHAGMSGAFNYQLMEKAMPELARNTEFALLQQTSTIGNATDVARAMKGLEDWADVVSVGGATTVLNEDTQFNLLAQDLWDNGESPDWVLCGGLIKRHITNFSNSDRVTYEHPMDDRRLINNVMIYEGDFGAQRITLERYVSETGVTRKMLMGSRRLLRTAWLQKTRAERQSRTGDLNPGIVKHELTLEMGNENGWGTIDNLSSAAP